MNKVYKKEKEVKKKKTIFNFFGITGQDGSYLKSFYSKRTS
tara:strand:- start:861 stop:983 length:123 start_codon:yes stop_codon:yes gene_type:complete